ncbi:MULTISPECIES: sensor histidine kinase [unclassified Streptomyces]|uniref:sensor histidine kinase n=1 Tax=unclassified Streptomyces TaxID=2593676 RepID=UPI00166031CD|nr:MULTISPECIES: histidine kinase [unclassified Streptomyces]MBD0710673.1 two-component sensor histidine kinase [Streptomyces sp. CBMA291]MBD0715520.1 two-component sensor histidine kinase [Streptomyces sp. CBMA370]
MPEDRRERLREHLFDLLLWLLLCVPVLLRSDPDDGGSWILVGVGTAVLALCVAVSRRWPLLALAVTVALSLPASLELFTPSYSLALIAFGYLAGRRQEHTRAALWLFGAVAGLGLLLTRLTHTSLGQWFTLLLALALAVVAPWLIGRYVRQYDHLVRSGWELADRMEREQAAVADRERLRERSRIAGDMHDSLGHDLALIAIRAGALEVSPALGPDEQRAAGELRRAAADATGRLRDIIGVLREEDPEAAAPTTPPGETVEELTARARASGLDVTLDTTPVPTLPGMSGLALHRVVQEGLTNAAKHAPGAPVSVSVTQDPANVRVRVVSGPGPAPEPGADEEKTPSGRGGSGGTGLVGLDERVRLAGGRIATRATEDGGFALEAVLPRRAPAPLPAAPTSARELDRARREVRKGLVRAVWIPLALLAALGVLMAGVALWTQAQSYLEPEDFARMRIGMTPAEIAKVSDDLPEHPLDGPPQGAPPEPPGMHECRYYRSTLLAAIPVYRLCFVDGHLADKAKVP